LLDLDHYLKQQRGEGDHCSEGSFSLSAEKSLAKLSKYQLERPELWLVKIVQCGVALGPSPVVIKLKRNILQVSFGQKLGLTAEELWEAVLTPKNLTPAQSHLVTGLRAVYGQHDDLAWICQDEHGTTLVTVKGDKIETRTSGDKGSAFQLLVERRSNRLGLHRWLGTSLAELDAVRQKCWLSPNPIHLDGRTLREVGDPAGKTVARHEASPLTGIESHLGSYRDPGKAGCVAETRTPIYFSTNPGPGYPYLQRFAGPESGHQLILALFTLESGEGLESLVRYVYHGAIVDGPSLKIKLKPGYALRVYVPVEELTVDLSQFRTEYPLLASLWNDINRQLQSFLEIFIDCLEGKLGGNKEMAPAAQGASATLATAATFIKTKALFFGFGLPVGLLVGGGMMTAAKMKSHNRRMERLDLRNMALAGLRQLKQFRY